MNGFQKFLRVVDGHEKLIFGYNNFFGSSHFSIHEILKMDQKLTRAKKFIGSKNQYFHNS